MYIFKFIFFKKEMLKKFKTDSDKKFIKERVKMMAIRKYIEFLRNV